MDTQQIKQLIAGYRPAEGTLNALRDISLTALVGPTAAGKTTLIENMVKLDSELYEVISDVSRPPREGEINGVDYHFRSEADMINDIVNGRFVQVVYTINDYVYGSRPENYANHGHALMGIFSSEIPNFRTLPFKQVKVICVIPPDYDTWQSRIKTHEFSPEQLADRMLEAERSLDFAATDKNIAILLNGDLSFASRMCLDIVLGRELNGEQKANQQKARESIRDLLGELHNSKRN